MMTWVDPGPPEFTNPRLLPTIGRLLVLTGGDSSFGNSGSAVTIITMVGHAMGTIGPVVGEKSGGQVQACPLPRLKALTLARFIACCEIFQCQGRG